jgi:hypothetical protein
LREYWTRWWLRRRRLFIFINHLRGAKSIATALPANCFRTQNAN